MRSANPLQLKTSLLTYMQTIILLIAGLFSFSSLAFSEDFLTSEKNLNLPQKTLGISQIVQHPALDAVREGLLTCLKEEGYVEGKNLNILYENAQGNIGISSQIASKLISSNIDVGVAISTPSAQTLFYAAERQGNKIPIVFSAVSDPATARLESNTYPITGVSDAPNLSALLELIHALLPNLKTLGLMYNPSEANSVSTITRLKALLHRHGIKVHEVTVNKTGDVAQAMHSLMGRVDALYFPQDNTVVAAIETVVNIAQHSSPALAVILPIFTNDTVLVKKGVLAAIGYDYTELGRATGHIVSRIFKGEDPTRITIQQPEHFKTVINGAIANQLGLKVPNSLQQSTVEVLN
jgi:putative ABC transport system substrate-binding protein